MSTADGKFVVVENNQIISKPTDKREEAEAEAKKLQQLRESQGRTSAPEVKQIIEG